MTFYGCCFCRKKHSKPFEGLFLAKSYPITRVNLRKKEL
jgi:hypothetical protein